jgi:hypothetical protein
MFIKYKENLHEHLAKLSKGVLLCLRYTQIVNLCKGFFNCLSNLCALKHGTFLLNFHWFSCTWFY